MKLLLITHDYYPNAHGGIARHIDLLLSQYQKLDSSLEIVVAVARDWRVAPQARRMETINAHLRLLYLGSDDLIDTNIQDPDLHFASLNTRLYSVLHQALLDLDFRPELIHLHTPILGLAALALKRNYACPLIYTEHSPVKLEGLMHRVYFSLRYYIMFQADRVIAVSSLTKEELLELFPLVPSNLIQVIPNGVDLSLFVKIDEDQFMQELENDAQKTENPYVVYVGRLAPEKSVATLLYAWQEVEPNLPITWSLQLAGDGPLRTGLEHLSHQLGLRRVHFLGALDETAIPCLLQRAQLCVVPSIEESFGLVLLEAMAAGTPVIASDIAPLNEIVTDGESARLFPVRNPRALAKTIMIALREYKNTQAIVTKASERVRDFSAERQAGQTLTLYKDVLEEAQLSDSL